MLSTGDQLQIQVHIQTESDGMVKIFHVNGNQNGVATLISDKTDFKIKTGTRDKEELYIDQGVNSRRRYNNYKYIRIQQKSTSIHKANPSIY